MKFGDVDRGIRIFADVLGIYPSEIRVVARLDTLVVPQFAEILLTPEQEAAWKKRRDEVHWMSWWNGGANGYYYRDEATLTDSERGCLEGRRKLMLHKSYKEWRHGESD